MTDENQYNSEGISNEWQAATNGLAEKGRYRHYRVPLNASYLSMRPYDVALDANNDIYTIQFVRSYDNPAYELLGFPPYIGQPEMVPNWANSMYPSLIEALGIAVNPAGILVSVAAQGPTDVEENPSGGLYLFQATNGDFIADIDEDQDACVDTAWDNVGNLYAALICPGGLPGVWRAYSPPGTNQSTTVAVPLIQAYQSIIPPNLVNPVANTNGMQFILQGQSNVTYVVQASCDLANWTPVKTNYSRSDNRCICVPAAGIQNFYRAVVSP